VTVRAGAYQDADTFKNMYKGALSAYAFGVEFGQKSVAGPMRISGQWCNVTGFSAFLTVGFDF
jgi:hypothetical protein